MNEMWTPNPAISVFLTAIASWASSDSTLEVAVSELTSVDARALEAHKGTIRDRRPLWAGSTAIYTTYSVSLYL